jgi:hypothetical protein
MGAITALVGELSLRGRLQITPVTIRLLDATATDDDLLDDAIRVVTGTRELWSSLEWLNILCANLSRVEPRLIERLALHGPLRRTTNGMYATRRAACSSASRMLPACWSAPTAKQNSR